MLRGLFITGFSPIDLLVTDPIGRRLGYDPATNQFYEEIPTGVYNHPSGGRADLWIFDALPGEYTLTIAGTDFGSYKVIALLSDSTATLPIFYQAGTVQPGDVQTVTISAPENANEVIYPPEVVAGSDATVNEGETLAFTGNVTDINPDETHTYTWDFGDGATAEGTLTPTHVYADDGEYTVTLTVSDSGGFTNEDTLKVTVVNRPPTVDAGNAVTVGSNQMVTFNGSFTDPGQLDTHTILWDFGDGSMVSNTLTPNHVYTIPGTYVVSLTVTDDDGGVANDTLLINVQYVFIGFFAPVDNLPILNTVKAGQAIPIKFSLGGNYGLNIFAQGYPSSSLVACGTTAEDAIEETATAGNSGLSYSPGNQQYTYVWKTDKAWAGTCRTFVIKLNDGTYHRANFKFK